MHVYVYICMYMNLIRSIRLCLHPGDSGVHGGAVAMEADWQDEEPTSDVNRFIIFLMPRMSGVFVLLGDANICFIPASLGVF